MVVGRCTRDDTLERAREVAPRRHAELQRYRRAGAWAAAAFTFPRRDANLVDFYESRLMLEDSGAVILQGDNPAGYVDLEVSVAPASVAGETLYVRRRRDVEVLQRAKAEAWAELLRRPDGMATWMEDVMRLPVGDFARRNPRLTEDVRSRMLEGSQVRASPPPRPVDYWAVSERFQGIERAGLVVVNLRDPAERPAAERLLVDMARLRKDAACQGRHAVQ